MLSTNLCGVYNMYRMKLGRKRLFNNPQRVKTYRGVRRTQRYTFGSANRRKWPRDWGM